MTPIAARTASGSRGHIVTGHPRLTAVGADQRGQDLYRGGLARTVRAEQGEDRSLGNMKVDAVEHDLFAV